MKRTSGRPCSVARTLAVLGDGWSPLILRAAFAGVCRFDGFCAELGIARNTLANRLAALTADGLLRKVVYQREPLRHEYLLTEQGRDFYPVLVAMAAWGDRWLAGESGRPMILHHNTCGNDTTAAVVCAACHQPLTSDTVQHRAGPGAVRH